MCKKAKWLSEEALQIPVKRREAKSKGEKERYTHLNTEFQTIERRGGFVTEPDIGEQAPGGACEDKDWSGAPRSQGRGKKGFSHICKSINVMHHINKLKDKNHVIISIEASLVAQLVKNPPAIQEIPV